MIMNTTKIRTVFFVAAIFLCVLAAPVSADWDEGDSYKMHFPQLPDPDGLGVANYNLSNGEPLLIADDWNCTETGYVTDIHIWGSWKNDSKGEIESFNVSIWSDDPGTNFSHPDKLLWQYTFFNSEFNESYWCNGFRGREEYRTNVTDSHMIMVISNLQNDTTWQYNLHIDPAKAFIQQEGTTYWLAITPYVNDSLNYSFGWRTSQDAWRDNFTIYVLTNSSEWPLSFVPVEEMWWCPRKNIEPQVDSDFAFVIDGPPLAPEVPLLTPTGLIALVGLLSVIAGVTIRRKRR